VGGGQEGDEYQHFDLKGRVQKDLICLRVVLWIIGPGQDIHRWWVLNFNFEFDFLKHFKLEYKKNSNPLFLSGRRFYGPFLPIG
jgi:hypothetical protein